MNDERKAIVDIKMSAVTTAAVTGVWSVEELTLVAFAPHTPAAHLMDHMAHQIQLLRKKLEALNGNDQHP